MSCTISHGVVLCQMGYLGVMFAAFAVVQAFVAAYLVGRWHAGRRATARRIGKDP